MPGEITENEVNGMRENPTVTGTEINKKMGAASDEPYLPSEIIVEILSWLPVIALLKFKKVCRDWKTIIEGRNFIEKHMTRAVGTFECTYKDANSSADGFKDKFSCMRTIRGLLLEKSRLTGKCRIRNPATRRVLNLPGPHWRHSEKSMCFLPSSGFYKLISYDKGNNEQAEFQILTVGIDASWRHLHVPSLLDFRAINRAQSVFLMCVKETIYIVRYNKSGWGDSDVVCIEMASERSAIVKIPPTFLQDNYEAFGAFLWNSSVVVTTINGEKLNVFLLENYREGKWTERKITLPSNIMEGTLKLDVTVRGDSLYFDSHHERLLYYNLKTGESKHVTSTMVVEKIGCTYHPTLESVTGMQPEP